MELYADQRGHSVAWMTAAEREQYGRAMAALVPTAKHEGQPKDTAAPYAAKHVRYLDVLTTAPKDPEAWVYE